MMKKILTSLILLMALQVSVFSQTPFVSVEFNINGKKSTKSRFSLWIHSGEKVIEIEGKKGRFAVPDEIKTIGNMDIKLKVGKFDVSFSDITPKYFDNKWIIGIDSPPFEAEELPTKDGKKPKLLYNVEFHPKNAVAVSQIVAIY